ncbi:hypothetical protein GCM10012275_37750 [Longimycelium tulufanense]|uniref:Transcriptional regulator n=1 Tax=Longimycelium tulufanense TaxID=907463 RepID=A0A8J3CGH1_9PSEU|nr:hypothetical protein [Longimycelium tulufanense]GGM63614.1 hypothetical protein GCM10012275_37750 [Longimycelium tulufanense]
MSLRAYLDRLGWSPERLAKEINRVSGPGAISSKAPYAWLRGSYPRGNTPRLVAEILGCHLGENVTVEKVWPDKWRHVVPPLPCAKAAVVTQGPLAEALRDVECGNPPLLADATVLTVAVDWAGEERARPRSQASGVELTPEVLDLVGTRVVELRRLQDDRSGPIVLDWAHHDLRWISGLTGGCAYDSAQAAELHRHLAELAEIAGWSAIDLGRHGCAQRYFLLALRATTAAGARELGAHALSCLGYLASWTGDPQGALRLHRIARHGASDSPRRLRALLACREARAHAMLGRRSAFEQAMDEAVTLAGTDSTGPTWLTWVSHATLVAKAGKSWIDLDQPDRAEQELLHSLPELGSHKPRNQLLHTITLAEARIRQGNAEGAADVVLAGLDQFAPHLGASRVRERLAVVRKALADRGTPASRTACAAITTILA